MDTFTDEALVRDIQAGNISAFEPLVVRYQEKLLAFVTYIVRDAATAADIVQESFITLYKTIDRVDADKKFSSYLFSIARNNAISFLRSRKFHVPIEDALDVPASDTPEQQLDASEETRRIREALDLIDRKYKQVISLYYFDDLSYEEMSKRLHLPVNTIRTHVRRAKDALRKVLPYEKR